MSGSSLDGLDMALCRFQLAAAPQPQVEEWEIVAATTREFPKPWQARLRMAPHLPAAEFWRLHVDLGRYFGQLAKQFLDQQSQKAQLVGAHGHTIFHRPDQQYTCQIGDGAALAAALDLPVVDQLRSSDLAQGGQGAPIAPLADRYLFPEYGAFLNLGGIANISIRTSAGPTPPPEAEDLREYKKSNQFLAGDISGANQILNKLAVAAGSLLPYDDGGRLAASGQLLPDMLETLAAVEYHQQAYPKSLANAWVQETLWPLVEQAEGTAVDKLHTFCRFLAQLIHDDLRRLAEQAELPPQPIQVMISGGGGHNRFLVECLRSLEQDDRYPLGYALPALNIINFKEAALVALAALWRKLAIPNAFASVTGAGKDTINGALYLPTTASNIS